MAAFSRQFDSTGPKRWPKFIVHPNATPRLTWDVAGMVLILYDIIVIPFNIGFQPEETAFLYGMLLLSSMFWTIDTVMTFFLAYYDQGKLETNRWRIAVHYAKTWLLVDLVIVLLDWFIIIVTSTSGADASSDTNAARLGRTFRMSRILRTIRLLRVLKFKKLLEELYDRISSEYVHIIFEILRLLIIITTINHFVACIWYAVGENGWVHANGYHDIGLDGKYMASLHWALTQMTPASMEIHPENTKERFISVLTVLLGIVIFSSFVSSMTAAVSHMRDLGMETQQEFWKLRRYLKAANISPDLSARINRYLEYKVQNDQQGVKVEDVQLLKHLSEPLRLEMEGESHRSLICEHPFFQMYFEADKHALRRLCYNVMSRVGLSKGDDLFTTGSESSCMYLVLHGTLRYFRIKVPSREAICATPSSPRESIPNGHTVDVSFGAERSVVCAKQWRRLSECLLALKKPKLSSIACVHVQDLSDGDWCCEAALWGPWVHKGTLRAISRACELVAIDAQKFRALTLRHEHVRGNATKYAKTFAAWLNDVDSYCMSDLDTREDAEQRISMAFGKTFT